MNLYSFPKTNQHTWKCSSMVGRWWTPGMYRSEVRGRTKMYQEFRKCKKVLPKMVFGTYDFEILFLLLSAMRCLSAIIDYYCIIFIILRHHSSLFIMIIHWLVSTYFASLHCYQFINPPFIIICHYFTLWMDLIWICHETLCTILQVTSSTRFAKVPLLTHLVSPLHKSLGQYLTSPFPELEP